jgi:cyclopropane-fatty-acyl-phospholipid synthase
MKTSVVENAERSIMSECSPRAATAHPPKVKPNRFKEIVRESLSLAGVEINGSNPWDIRVNHEEFYQRILAEGSLGLGETYMQGWWACQSLDEFFYRILRHQLADRVKANLSLVKNALLAKFFNMQTRAKAFRNGQAHYDLSNELFVKMLDRRMVYTCGYWKGAATLDEAQEAKLDLVCRKAGLKPGMKVLDIGCGWGSWAKYAAEKYRVEVVGITVSRAQAELGRELCKGLPVEIRLQDYREVNERFDCVVSLGMFEHVGGKNYQTYMNVVHRCLADDGLFLLHTIGGNRSVRAIDPWFNKYIFPNGMVPSIKQVGASIEGLFVMEDWHNFSADYDKTLMAWHENIERHWGSLASRYDEKFHTMWRYYLLSCAGAFRARENQLWQIVLSKRGVVGGYQSIR